MCAHQKGTQECYDRQETGSCSSAERFVKVIGAQVQAAYLCICHAAAYSEWFPGNVTIYLYAWVRLDGGNRFLRSG